MLVVSAFRRRVVWLWRSKPVGNSLITDAIMDLCQGNVSVDVAGSLDSWSQARITKVATTGIIHDYYRTDTHAA